MQYAYLTTLTVSNLTALKPVRLCIMWVLVLLCAVNYNHANTIKITASQKDKGYSQTVKTYNLDQASSLFTISEKLDQLSSISMMRLGAPGTYSAARIRGSSNSTVGIYFDGVPLNDNSFSTVNLESFSGFLVQKAEVYETHTPLHLPGIHMAGSIDLLPAKKSRGQSVLLSTKATSLLGTELNTGYLSEKLTIGTSLGMSKNKYEYRDTNGTPYFNEIDDTVQNRQNEDYQKLSFFASFADNYSSGNLKLLAAATNHERGLPGTIGLPLNNVRNLSTSGLFRASYDYLVSPSIILNSYLIARFLNSQTTDEAGELPEGLQNTKRDDIQLSGGITPSFFIGKSTELKLNASASYAQIYLNEDLLATRYRVENGAAANYAVWFYPWDLTASTKASFTKDLPAYAFHPSLNYYPMKKSEALIVSGKIFSRLCLDPIYRNLKKCKSDQNNLYFLTSFGVSGREATINERYGDGTTLLPASDLEPESSKNIDIGLEATVLGEDYVIKFEQLVFQQQIENLIVLISNSQKTFIARNISKSKITGSKSSISINYLQAWSFSTHYTYLRTMQLSQLTYYDGKYLPYRPNHSWSVFFSYAHSIYRFSMNYDYEGETYRDQYNSLYSYIKARNFFNVIFEVGRKKGIGKFQFAVKNILDEKKADVLGYPLPGRSYHVGYEKEISL
jgi:vitamin B12 transporter